MMCPTSTSEKLLLYVMPIIFLIFWNIRNINCWGEEKERTAALLKSLSYSHIGSFVSSSYCSNSGRSYMSGAKVRFTSHLNQSHPLVSAVEFMCSDAIRPAVHADRVLLMQKNIGNWTEMKECPNGGFVTGITFYMQSLSSSSLMADEDTRNFTLKFSGPDTAKYFDIFELGRTRYISGVSLNCSFNRDYENDMDGLMESEESNNSTNTSSTSIPAWRNMVTMGRPSGMGLRLYCSDDRVVSGISVEQEALLTYDEGERWIPLDITTRCSLLTNPVKHCYPELDWERIDERNMTCTNVGTGNDAFNSTTQTGLANVTCHISHFFGLSLNADIENVDRIIRAYEPMGLDGKETKHFLRSKLFTSLFQREWQRTYKLSVEDYKAAVEERPVDTYLNIKNESHVINFSNVNYDESDYSKLIRDKSKEPLKYDYNVKQLVGYCSIYKIYFPLFKSQFQTYFERRIDGIESRIIFPHVDENTSISDIIEAKFGIKLLK